MELRHLRYFVAVAERGHFGRAAAALHVSTPTLSQQIRALEREIGTPLLVRDRRGALLTGAGAALMPEARRTLDAAEAALREARRAGGVETPAVRIGLLAGLPDWLPAKLDRLLTSRGAHAVLIGGSTSEQIDALTRGELDLALVRCPLDLPTGTELLLVAEEELGVLMPVDHPLAHHSVLKPRDLDGQRLVWFPRQSAPGFHDAVLHALARLDVHVIISESTMSWGQRRSGFAVTTGAISLSTARAAETDDLTWRPLDGRPLTATIGCAWRTATRNSAVQELLARLRRFPGPGGRSARI